MLLPVFLAALELTVLQDAPPLDANGRARVRILFGSLCALALLWLSVRSGIVGGLAGDRPHVALKGLWIAERSWVLTNRVVLAPTILSRMVGMPSGRFFEVPGFEIHCRRTGLGR